MFKIGAVTVTRRSNYDKLKHLISLMVILDNEKRLPSAVDLSRMLGINKSSISRAIINLYEQDRWLEKIDNGHPRTSYYIIIANKHQAEAFRSYFLLPTRKKVQFKRCIEHAKQKYKSEANWSWKFESNEWDKFHQQYLGFGARKEVKAN